MNKPQQTMKQKQQERNYKTLCKNNPAHRQVLNTSCYMTLNRQVFTDSFLVCELVEKDYNKYIPNVEETTFTYPDMSRILDTTYHTFTDKIEVNNTTLIKNLKTTLKGGKRFIEFNVGNLEEKHYNVQNNHEYKTYIDIKKFIQAIEFITPDKNEWVSLTIDQKGFIHITNNNKSKCMLMCCQLPLFNKYDKDKDTEECYESEEERIDKLKKEIITYDSLMSDNLQTLIHIKAIEKITCKTGWDFNTIKEYADKNYMQYIQQQIGNIITLYLRLDNIKEYVFTCEVEHKNNSVITHFKARLED